MDHIAWTGAKYGPQWPYISRVSPYMDLNGHNQSASLPFISPLGSLFVKDAHSSEGASPRSLSSVPSENTKQRCSCSATQT